MRRLMSKKPGSWMLVGLLITCPFWATEIRANLRQVLPAGVAKPAVENRPKTERVPLSGNQNQVLARNTAAKVEVTPVKEQTIQDKKTIGRCWQRLMNTFREINLAHRNRTR